MRNNYLYNEFKYIKFAHFNHVGDSGVTVIMAASQAVDPGSTPGCRTIVLFSIQNIIFPSLLSYLFQ